MLEGCEAVDEVVERRALASGLSSYTPTTHIFVLAGKPGSVAGAIEEHKSSHKFALSTPRG